MAKMLSLVALSMTWRSAETIQQRPHGVRTMEKEQQTSYDTCDEAQEYLDENCIVPTPAPTPCEDGDSCEAWADPHISGFDNDAIKGPDYLSLVSNDGKDIELSGGNGKVSYRTYFNSFDKRRSELYRRNKSSPDKSKHPTKSNHSSVVEDVQQELKGSESLDGNEENDTEASEMDVNAYESGDFWLVKSIPIHIQGRFRLAQEFLPDNAAIGAVAVGGPFLGGHKFTIEPLDGDVTMDGVPMPTGSFTQSSEMGNITMQYFDAPKNKPGMEYADFDASLPMGVKLKLRRWNRHLDIKITLPKKIPGGVDGECGNMNGKSEDDSQDHIKDRMGALNIAKKEKLFMKSFNVWVNFDAQGFGAVQATGENRTMERFIRLLLANRGAQLMNEADLSGILPYYTGEEEKYNFNDLQYELRTADWVQGYDSDGSWLFGPVGRMVKKLRKQMGLR